MTLKEKLHKLIQEEPGIRTSAIIEKMPYPCIDIIETLDELKEEGKVESKPIQIIEEKWIDNPNKSSEESK